MKELKIGSKAPAFKGVDQNGEEISLKDFEGKKLILYFYPHDDTPTCTTQACNLRDNYANLLQDGFEIVGVSTDPVKKHKKFEEKYDLPFALIADEEHKSQINMVCGVRKNSWAEHLTASTGLLF
jgi:peroxiredoxin Q/BCP